MATTHDMRYESEQSRSTLWSWLVPLAIIIVAAIAFAAYLNRDTTTTDINSGIGDTSSLYLDTPAQ
jgi:hypothetical protein